MQTVPPLPPMPNFIFWNEVIIPLAGMLMAVILGFPILRAVVRRIERGGSRSADAPIERLQAEMAELRARLDGVEQVSQRMAELEERLDFAERVLTQRREGRSLAAGD